MYPTVNISFFVFITSVLGSAVYVAVIKTGTGNTVQFRGYSYSLGFCNSYSELEDMLRVEFNSITRTEERRMDCVCCSHRRGKEDRR